MSRTLIASTVILAAIGLPLSQALGQAAAKKSTKAQVPHSPAPPPPPSPASSSALSLPIEANRVSSVLGSAEHLDLSEGRYGFSFGFPDGGTTFGAGFVGGRYFLGPNEAVGAYLLLGNDSAAKSNSVGLAGKYQRYFAQHERINLYWFGQLTLGQNGGTANKGKDDFLFGLGGGGGLEYSLLKDFTVSAEGGMGFNTLPKSKNAFATGTGKLAVNFYY